MFKHLMIFHNSVKYEGALDKTQVKNEETMNP